MNFDFKQLFLIYCEMLFYILVLLSLLLMKNFQKSLSAAIVWIA